MSKVDWENEYRNRKPVEKTDKEVAKEYSDWLRSLPKEHQYHKLTQALAIAKDALEKISLGESEMISTEDLWPWAENKALEALKDIEKVME